MNSKTFGVCFFLSLFTAFSIGKQLHAQSIDYKIPEGKSWTLRANFIECGFGFEYGFTKNFTYSTQVAMFPSIAAFSTNEGTQYEFYQNWTWESSIRYFHNINRRIRLGKNVSGFSGNYFGAKYSFPLQSIVYYSENRYYFHSIGVHYGIQRVFWKYGYFNFSAGPKYYWNNQPGEITLDLNLGLGIQF